MAPASFVRNIFVAEFFNILLTQKRKTFNVRHYTIPPPAGF